MTTENFNEEKMKGLSDDELRAKKIKNPKHYSEAMYNKALDWELERRERERKPSTREQPTN
jgi:hypothetical protein